MAMLFNGRLRKLNAFLNLPLYVLSGEASSILKMNFRFAAAPDFHYLYKKN